MSVTPVNSGAARYLQVPTPQRHDRDYETAQLVASMETGQVGLAEGVRTADQRRREMCVDPSNLYEILREATLGVHFKAMINPYLVSLVRGHVCEGYITYLKNLQAIHRALEKAQMSCPEDSAISTFVIRELWRSEWIEKDLKTWSSVFDCDSAPIAPITKNFEERLASLLQENPNLLVAPMWVFYGTVLSGGQVIAGGIKPTYDRISGTSERYVGVESFNVSALGQARDFKEKIWHPLLADFLKRIPEADREQFIARCKQEAMYAFEVSLGFIREVIQSC